MGQDLLATGSPTPRESLRRAAHRAGETGVNLTLIPQESAHSGPAADLGAEELVSHGVIYTCPRAECYRRFTALKTHDCSTGKGLAVSLF